jgi:DNA-binding NarL/FixJ family response regulator
MAVKIIVVDDQPTVRLHVREAIEAARDLEVIGEATPGSAAIALVAMVHPDIVLVDVHSSPATGLGMTRLVRDRFPRVRVVAVGDPDSLVRDEAVRAGAWAFVPTTWTGEEVAHVVRSVARGSRQGLVDLTAASQRASPR